MRRTCSAEQLIAWLDGEGDAEIARCLTGCAACTACIGAYSALQQDILRVFHRRHCPSGQDLANFHWGLLDTAQSQAVKAHLAGCPFCPAELEELRQFLADIQLFDAGQVNNIRLG